MASTGRERDAVMMAWYRSKKFGAVRTTNGAGTRISPSTALPLATGEEPPRSG